MMGNLSRETINGKIFLVGEINARKCSNLKKLLLELAETFNVPEYFYVNLNALDEGMYDLSWHQEKNYKIIVRKFNTLTDQKQKNMITEELNFYKTHWDEKRISEKDNEENHFIVEYTE